MLYDANADDAGGTVTDPKYYITGGEAMVLKNMFTRPGYEFTGWNTEKNGTGTPYAAGECHHYRKHRCDPVRPVEIHSGQLHRETLSRKSGW